LNTFTIIYSQLFVTSFDRISKLSTEELSQSSKILQSFKTLKHGALQLKGSYKKLSPAHQIRVWFGLSAVAMAIMS